MQAFLHLEYNFVSFSEKQTFVTYGIDNILTTRSFTTQLIVSVNMYSISFFSGFVRYFPEYVFTREDIILFCNIDKYQFLYKC